MKRKNLAMLLSQNTGWSPDRLNSYRICSGIRYDCANGDSICNTT